MSSGPAAQETLTLGEHLREARITLGVELAAVAKETKISLRSLQAIEENDFAALPAEAYARGFYSLYAKSLSLEPEEVLQRYMEERPDQQKSLQANTLPMGKMAQEVGNMAERPSFVPFSFFGLLVLLFLLFSGVLCWYFSWNPATFLSQKLRSLGEPEQISRLSEAPGNSGWSKGDLQFAVLEKLGPQYHKLLNISYPTVATAAITERMDESAEEFPAVRGKYSISAEFSGQTEVRLILDNQPERTFLFKSGDKASWQANDMAILTLPPQAATKLTCNNTPITLPESKKDLITLRLPEQLPQ